MTGYANGSFPTASPRQAASGGQRDAFIVKLTAAPSAYDETYVYDTVGNITLKGPTGNGKVYTYGAQSAGCASGALIKRHAGVFYDPQEDQYLVGDAALMHAARKAEAYESRTDPEDWQIPLFGDWPTY